jgi:hypothetical protein
LFFLETRKEFIDAACGRTEVNCPASYLFSRKIYPLRLSLKQKKSKLTFPLPPRRNFKQATLNGALLQKSY